MADGNQLVLLDQKVDLQSDLNGSLKSDVPLKMNGGKAITVLVWLVITCATIFGCVCRVTDINGRFFWRDEAVTQLLIGRYPPAAIYDRFVKSDELIKSTQVGSSVVDVVTFIANHCGEQLPLYYVCARLWADWLGNVPLVLRYLSVIFGTLLLPATYFLGQSIFGSRVAGGITCALIAVAPFHLWYSQQARPYELCALMCTLATLALTVAVRQPSLKRWTLYAVLCTIMLYSHFLGIGVAAAHGLIALLQKNIRVFFGFVGAGLVGCLLVLPWYIYLFLPMLIPTLRSHITPYTGWLDVVDNSPLFHVLSMAPSVSQAVYDTGNAQPDAIVICIWGLLLACCAIGLRYFGRSAAIPIAIFTVSIFAVVMNDICTCADTARISRYLTPVYIAVPLIVCGAIRAGLQQKQLILRLASAIAFILFIASGVVSCISYKQNPFFHGQSQQLAVLSENIRKRTAPTVITSLEPSAAISLCYLLPAGSKVELVKELPSPDSVGLSDFNTVEWFPRENHYLLQHYANGRLLWHIDQ